MEKGLVNLENFRKNPGKRQYAYLVTKAVLDEKTRISRTFLRRKIAKYETLEKEIERLRGDLTAGGTTSGVLDEGRNSFPEQRTRNHDYDVAVGSDPFPLNKALT